MCSYESRGFGGIDYREIGCSACLWITWGHRSSLREAERASQPPPGSPPTGVALFILGCYPDVIRTVLRNFPSKQMAIPRNTAGTCASHGALRRTHTGRREDMVPLLFFCRGSSGGFAPDLFFDAQPAVLTPSRAAFMYKSLTTKPLARRAAAAGTICRFRKEEPHHRFSERLNQRDSLICC